MLKVTAVDYTNLDAVCLALKTNTTFLKLDFSGNKIDVDTVPAVADLLRTNNTLTWLDLSGNELLNEGVSRCDRRATGGGFWMGPRLWSGFLFR